MTDRLWYSASSEEQENVNFQIKLKDFLNNSNNSNYGKEKLKNVFDAYKAVRKRQDEMILVITKTQLDSLWNILWATKNQKDSYSLRNVLNELIKDWKEAQKAKTKEVKSKVVEVKKEPEKVEPKNIKKAVNKKAKESWKSNEKIEYKKNISFDKVKEAYKKKSVF